MRLLKLVPDNTNLDFMRWRNVALIFSILITAAAIVLVFTRGLNFGVDFVGGQSVRVAFVQPPAQNALEAQIGTLGVGSTTIQQTQQTAAQQASAGNAGPNLTEYVIRIALRPGADDAAADAALVRAMIEST